MNNKTVLLKSGHPQVACGMTTCTVPPVQYIEGEIAANTSAMLAYMTTCMY